MIPGDLIPGDLVRSMCFLDLHQISDEKLGFWDSLDGIPMNSIGTVLSPPKRNWVKLLVDGKVGWVNWTLLEVLR